MNSLQRLTISNRSLLSFFLPFAYLPSLSLSLVLLFCANPEKARHSMRGSFVCLGLCRLFFSTPNSKSNDNNNKNNDQKGHEHHRAQHLPKSDTHTHLPIRTS